MFSSWGSWLKRNFAGNSKSHKSRTWCRQRVRLQVEILEERELLDSGGGAGQLFGNNLIYSGGGPLIANVSIHLIFFQDALTHKETSPAVQAQLHAFFNTMTTNSYIANLLSQYSIPGSTIGHGTVGVDDTNVQVTPDQPNSMDEVATIQPVIRREINAGRTAAPNANNLYFVFMPPGDTFTGNEVGGDLGFHRNLLDSNGVNQDYYAVIADPGSPPYLADLNFDSFQQLTMVSSHELAEAITDPTPNTEWTDWTDPAYGMEVGDMANFETYTQDGYVVQYMWSNALQGPAHALGTTAQNLFINQLAPPAVDTWIGGPVATFTDTDPALTSASFTAFVDFQPATVGGGAQGVYTVSVNASYGDAQHGYPFSYQEGMNVEVYDTHSLPLGQGGPVSYRYQPYLVSPSAPLTYNADSGGLAHNFVLKENASTHNFELTDNGNLVFTQPIAQTTNINIQADSGGTVDSSLTLDYSGGKFSNNVTFDGGNGTGSHTLTLEGTMFTSDTLTTTGPEAGTFHLDGQIVTFTHVTATNDLTKGTSNTATHLALINPLPPSSVTSGASFPVHVAAEDSTNATDPIYSASITITVTNGPGSFNVGDITTLSASGGVVIFSSLHLVQAGVYTLQVSSESLTPVSFSLTVNPKVTNPATHLALINPLVPNSVTSGAGFAVNVAAEDATNATDPNYSGSITITVTNGPGTFTTGDITTFPASGGVVDFATLHLNQAGVYTLQVSSTGLTPISLSLTVNPQRFSFTMPSSVPVNSPFNVMLTALNADGSTSTNFNGSADQLTLTLASGPGNLSGAIPANPSLGLANFANLKLDDAGTYTFMVSGGGITATNLNSITVTASPTFSFSLPSTIPSNAPFNVIVTRLNPDGSVATGFFTFGPLTLASGPGTLSGGTLTIHNGVATFANVRLAAAGTYIFKISGGGSVTGTSPQAIIVTANHLVFKGGSIPGTLMSGQQFGMTVLAEDVLGNTDPNFGGTITIAISTAAGGGGTLTGTLTVAANAGAAGFGGLFLDKATVYTLSASGGGMTQAKTGSIVVTASQLAFTMLPPNNQIAWGSYLMIQVSALDINNQRAGNFADGLPLTITSGPARVGSTVYAHASGGLASFGLPLLPPGIYTISVADLGKVPAISTTITVTTTDNVPTLAAIANQTMTHGTSKSVTLSYSDIDGDPLTLSFQGSNPLFTPQSQLQLNVAGPANNPFYFNLYGKQEKWLKSKGNGNWYGIISNGNVYAFTGNPVNPFGTLVGSFGSVVYAVPTQLTNAQQVTVNFSLVGNVLTITPTATYTGLIQITVTVSDGFHSTSKTFTVTVT